jgi:tRNA dimethylallyltransferase
MLPRIVAIVGATGSGKTALGEELALRFKGEIVSADAKQIYQGMDIGTAKELNLKVKQHLIDFKEPGQKITVYEYQQLAYSVLDELLKNHKQPFLVGGSGLYVEAVTEGYVFASQTTLKTSRSSPRYQVLKIAIQIDREQLKKRVEIRTRQWLQQGLLEEIEKLLASGVSLDWLVSCGMSYKYFPQYLNGTISLEEAVLRTNTETNQYIKRQYTWWRRHSDLNWVNDKSEALALVDSFIKC